MLNQADLVALWITLSLAAITTLILLVVGTALAVAGTLMCFRSEYAGWIVEESGPIEQATWITYIVAAVLALLIGVVRRWGAAFAATFAALSLLGLS